MRGPAAVSVCVSGRVIRGYRRARLVGFPTANIELSLPLDAPEGSYVGWARVGTEQTRHAALAFYGIPHAIEGALKPRLEVHLLGRSDDIYGESIELELVSFLRPNQQFKTEDELTAAIHNDFEMAQNFFSSKSNP